MGLENRDYYRDDRRDLERPSAFADVPVVCKRLLIANIVVFFLQMFVTRPMTIQDIPPETIQQFEKHVDQAREQGAPETFSVDDMIERQLSFQQVSVVQQWCSLDPTKVAKGQIWRLVTCAFCHDRMSIWHLVFNMLFLFWFGTRLESRYGPKEFALFYFASAIASSVAFLLLHWYTGDLTPAIGASGAVWGVVALYALLHPYERIRLYFLFPIEIRWLALLYVLYDLHPVLLALSGDARHDGVAHAAHLGGAAFGLMYYKGTWKLSTWWDRLPISSKSQEWAPKRRAAGSRTAAKPSPKPMPKADIELEIQLDDVLAKISREGRDSLTDEEVAVLNKASQHFRDDK